MVVGSTEVIKICPTNRRITAAQTENKNSANLTASSVPHTLSAIA